MANLLEPISSDLSTQTHNPEMDAKRIPWLNSLMFP
jgi:hypothetical protein